MLLYVTFTIHTNVSQNDSRPLPHPSPPKGTIKLYLAVAKKMRRRQNKLN